MMWPWVSRKRYEEQIRLAEREINAAVNDMAAAIDASAKHERNSKTLQSVVTTLRGELTENRAALVKLKAELIAKDATIATLNERLNRPAPVQQPQLGNLLRTRDRLEAATRQGIPVSEKEPKIEPDKELSNGQR